jgi:hypothetical protein
MIFMQVCYQLRVNTMGMGARGYLWPRGRVAAHPPSAFPPVQVRRRSVGYLFVRSSVHSFIRSFDRSIGRWDQGIA